MRLKSYCDSDTLPQNTNIMKLHTIYQASGHDKASASTNYAWHDRRSKERAVVHPFIASEPGLNHGVTRNIIGNYSSFD